MRQDELSTSEIALPQTSETRATIAFASSSQDTGAVVRIYEPILQDVCPVCGEDRPLVAKYGWCKQCCWELLDYHARGKEESDTLCVSCWRQLINPDGLFCMLSKCQQRKRRYLYALDHVSRAHGLAYAVLSADKLETRMTWNSKSAENIERMVAHAGLRMEAFEARSEGLDRGHFGIVCGG